MDRSYEPSAPYEEKPINIRMADQVNSPRSWGRLVPLRIKTSGLKQSGLIYPVGVDKTDHSSIRMDGTPSILSFASGCFWLVTTLSPEGPLEDIEPFQEGDPLLRVDGESTRANLTVAPGGTMCLVNVDISKAVLQSMAARVLDAAPYSSILVRLLPRYATGAVRWFSDHRVLQLWVAI